MTFYCQGSSRRSAGIAVLIISFIVSQAAKQKNESKNALSHFYENLKPCLQPGSRVRDAQKQLSKSPKVSCTNCTPDIKGNFLQ